MPGPFGAVLAVPTVRVRSEEVNAGANVARLQAFHEGVAVQAAGALINAHDKEMPRVSVRPRGVGKRQDAVNIRKTSAVNRGDFIAAFDDGVKAR